MLYTNGGTFNNRLRAQAAARLPHTHLEDQHSMDCATCCVECSGPHCCPQCPPCVSPTGTCNGEEVHGSHSKLPFVHPAGNCTSTLCAIFATSLDGPWTMRNVDSPCTNNAVPFQVCAVPNPFCCRVIPRLVASRMLVSACWVLGPVEEWLAAHGWYLRGEHCYALASASHEQQHHSSAQQLLRCSDAHAKPSSLRWVCSGRALTPSRSG